MALRRKKLHAILKKVETIVVRILKKICVIDVRLEKRDYIILRVLYVLVEACSMHVVVY